MCSGKSLQLLCILPLGMWCLSASRIMLVKVLFAVRELEGGAISEKAVSEPLQSQQYQQKSSNMVMETVQAQSVSQQQPQQHMIRQVLMDGRSDYPQQNFQNPYQSQMIQCVTSRSLCSCCCCDQPLLS